MVDLVIPIAVPNLIELRKFAYALHEQAVAWSGDYEGWPAYYTPEDRSQKPPNSKQMFRPAEFWIGTDRFGPLPCPGKTDQMKSQSRWKAKLTIAVHSTKHLTALMFCGKQ